MSKNLTRKGLALGAAVALGSTLFAGAPAFAVDPVTLEPSSGTSYNTILGESLVLQSIFTDAAQQGSEALKFKIVDSSKKLSLTNSGWDTATATTDRSVDTQLTDGNSDGTYFISTGNTVGPNKNFLVLADNAATATFSVTVQSWLDWDGDDVIDTGEAASAERTVKFVKPSEVATTLAFTPIEGDTQVSVKFSLADINQEQLTAAEFGVRLTDGNGAELAGSAADDYVIDQETTGSATAVSFSSTDKVFSGKSGSVTALAKGTSVKAQVLYENSNTTDIATTATAVGSSNTVAVTTRKVALFTAAIVRSATAIEDTANAGSYHVLRNSTFKLKATATDSATPAAKVAGVPVEVTITVPTGVLSSTKTLAVNGTVYSDESKLPGATGVAALKTTTDANGEAIVEFTTVGFAEWDSVNASFAAENFTSAVLVASRDASYSAYLVEDNAATGSSTANSNVTILEGATVPFTVAVRDQFGGKPADNTYEARVVLNNAGARTTASTSAASVLAAVAGGQATVNLVDKGKGTGTDTYDIIVSKKAAGGGYVSGSDIAVDTVNVIVVSAATAGKITLTSNSAEKNTSDVFVVKGTGTLTAPQKFALELADFGAFDAREVLGTEPDLNAGVRLTGAVQTAAGVGLAGAPLTISGEGLQFKAYGVDTYAVGSLTVRTGASGAYDIEVSSNKSGKQTVTLTSGAYSQKVEVTFAAAAENTATVIDVVAPATITPGATLTISGTLKDKYGNVVDTNQDTDSTRLTAATFSVKYTGPGFVVGGSEPVDTDADGKFEFKVILGANDSGTASVTVKYDQDGTGTTAEITKSASTTIAAPVVVAPEVKTTIVGVTKSVRVRVENAKGEEVEIKFGSKTVRVAIAGTNSKLWVINTTKGKKSVKVYVDGDLVAVKTVTVK